MVYRNPIECPHCGYLNEFKYNKRTLKQRLYMFIGDTGGAYPTKCKVCKRSFFKITPIKLTDEQKKFFKNLGKKS